MLWEAGNGEIKIVGVPMDASPTDFRRSFPMGDNRARRSPAQFLWKNNSPLDVPDNLGRIKKKHTANSRQQLAAWADAWRSTNRNFSMQDFQTFSDGSI